MVGGLPGGKHMGMFLSFVRVSSWSAMSSKRMGFGGFCPWKSRGGNRVGGETLPLGSGASDSVVRRCGGLRPGGGQVGWGLHHCQHKLS